MRANSNCVRAEAQGEVFGEIAGIRSLCGIPVWPLILLDKCTLPHLAGVLEKRGFFSPIFSFYFFFLSFFSPLAGCPFSGASPLCLPQPRLAAARLRAAVP